MNLSENNNQLQESNNQFSENELKQNIIKEEKKDEILLIEKEPQKQDFNQIESSNIEDKDSILVNGINIEQKNEPININTNNININETEIIIESNKTKCANHEIIHECINNCINWTLRAHINKKNNQNFKFNYTFQGKNVFFPKLEYSILNAMNNSSSFEKCFPKNNNFENKKKILEKLKQESISQLNNIDKNKNEKNEKHLSENASLKSILEFNP